MQQARSLWPSKTADHLLVITGYSLRHIRAWLAGDAKIPSDALASLLHSEWGLEFLSAVMAESRVPWWRRLLRINLTASILRRRAADRRLLEHALEEDQEVCDALARAEVALAAGSFRDPDFYSPHSDALEPARGNRARPLAGRHPGSPKTRGT